MNSKKRNLVRIFSVLGTLRHELEKKNRNLVVIFFSLGFFARHVTTPRRYHPPRSKVVKKILASAEAIKATSRLQKGIDFLTGTAPGRKRPPKMTHRGSKRYLSGRGWMMVLHGNALLSALWCDRRKEINLVFFVEKGRRVERLSPLRRHALSAPRIRQHISGITMLPGGRRTFLRISGVSPKKSSAASRQAGSRLVR
jgi:hypothetical protein